MKTGNETIDRANGHYTIITADSHAGGSHAAYREYLDPKYLEEFDAWRAKYNNPFKDLGDTRRLRNWDNDMRNGQQEADGVVGEVIFPNTIPPFFPNFVLFAGPPRAEDYEQRLAGIRAHNRWLVDWCEEFPGPPGRHRPDLPQRHRRRHRRRPLDQGPRSPRRAPPSQCRTRCHVGPTALRPRVRPTLGGHLGPRDARQRPRRHGRPGLRRQPDSHAVLHQRGVFYSQRPFVQFVLGGVFERFPRLKFVMTEMGCSWVADAAQGYRRRHDRIRDTGQTGEIRYGDEHKNSLGQ